MQFYFFFLHTKKCKKRLKTMHILVKNCLFISKSGRFLFLPAGKYPKCYKNAQIHLFHNRTCWYGLFFSPSHEIMSKKLKNMHIFAKKLFFSSEKVADFCCYRPESIQSVTKLLEYIHTVIVHVPLV